MLRLSNNRIAHLPASMATLGCLQRLDLSFNVLEVSYESVRVGLRTYVSVDVV